MDNFSIMSLNVHNFCNSDMKDSLLDVKSLILKYDIIALQEVYNKEKLGEIVEGYNYSYNRGLLLMTKHRIELLKNKSNDKFISLFILLNGIKIFVTNVHLNYIDEKVRNEEIDDILEKINTYTHEYPSILLGDFNALTKSDYTVKEWSDIFNVRKYGQWELPVHELTDKLKEEWYDCGKYNPLVTSRYNTRVDYIYTKNMKIIHYNIEETMPSISDHNLVMMRFGI